LKWSIGLEAETERVMTREEIVELADAVARLDGVASGIGKNCYGAQLLVEADTREQAIKKASDEFVLAAARAGLPACPIVRVEAASEEDEVDDEMDGGYR
jgi:hypothetical protein